MLIRRKRAAGREKRFVGRSGPEWHKVVLGREISRGQTQLLPQPPLVPNRATTAQQPLLPFSPTTNFSPNSAPSCPTPLPHRRAAAAQEGDWLRVREVPVPFLSFKAPASQRPPTSDPRSPPSPIFDTAFPYPIDGEAVASTGDGFGTTRTLPCGG